MLLKVKLYKVTITQIISKIKAVYTQNSPRSSHFTAFYCHLCPLWHTGVLLFPILPLPMSHHSQKLALVEIFIPQKLADIIN